MDKTLLQQIFSKTSGHCHFCGETLEFRQYGKSKWTQGNWNADHIYPKAKGGRNTIENYLPICGICNGLRWHRTGEEVQKIFRYGITALWEIRHRTSVGKSLRRLYERQLQQNEKRRKAS